MVFKEQGGDQPDQRKFVGGRKTTTRTHNYVWHKRLDTSPTDSSLYLKCWISSVKNTERTKWNQIETVFCISFHTLSLKYGGRLIFI